ncbi:MAG: ATP-binding protein [Actinomycetota bacterium]|nr:ATP-binding protein [Actinomycetota bacterium]
MPRVEGTDILRASVDLAAERTSPRTARVLLRELMADDDEATIATAELLITELVTNAIVHTGSGPHLDVELFPDHLWVSVEDTDPTPPVRRRPQPTRPGGRGIVILEELSNHWGVRPTGAGKSVWFELDRAAVSVRGR